MDPDSPWGTSRGKATLISGKTPCQKLKTVPCDDGIVARISNAVILPFDHGDAIRKKRKEREYSGVETAFLGTFKTDFF